MLLVCVYGCIYVPRSQLRAGQATNVDIRSPRGECMGILLPRPLVFAHRSSERGWDLVNA